ncbi:TonB-dependent receptor [Flagellimonas flava]|uniref:Iron complex outermembrane recepter protein n=1 Tax=Flagellimonas flava TaxID=570519 RepID=A0A1M5MCU0_9FLAO|nr:TonB-dependent receptor [Allomuricauda flava]SHG75130.1 iron complex outermembrane recepter protein [Allomuricauda flava]
MLRSVLLLIILLPFYCFSQNIEVSGKVQSAEGPLLGVSVIEQGTTNGTTTDFKGNYAIRVSSGASLVFSYLGFKTQEVAVNSNSINVTLEEDASQLEEVVVKGFDNVVGRARRRAESVQSIPESVVTFTAQAIETKGINNVQTFADQIPNVNFTTSQNIGNNFITVRGISHIRNGESPIAFVIDGVTLPDANLINQELFDLALIEIVKGPQGALYGRNAIAGAINIVTNEPTNTSRNKIQFGYGNGNLLQAQLSSTGPLVKDKLFYRISGSYKKGDGLLNNVTLNTAPDFVEDLSIRGQLKAVLSSNTTATLTGQFIDAEAGAVYYASPTTGNPTIDPDDFDNLAIQGDQFGRSTLDAIYGNLKVDFNFGNVRLTSSSSYNKGERNHIGDLDFTPADVLRQIQDSNTETINQEFRLSSTDTDSKVSWDLGAFYQKLDKQLITDATADFGFFAPPFEPTGTQSRLAIGNFTNTYNTLAAFGFMDFQVSDKLTLSAGLRFDRDNIQQDNVTENTNPEKTDTQLQPKLSLALKATENTLLYANYGRGYRTGGFNQGNTVRYDSDFEAETTDNYEIGMKNTLWDGRFILNLSGYYIDFNNQQLYALVLDGGNGSILIGNFNVPESESVGFEADLKLRATNWLDILGSYGVSKARITEGTSTVSTGANETINVSGNNTPLVPQNSYSFGLESSFDIAKNISFNGNVNVEGTGEIYWHEDNVAVSSGYDLLNARLGVTFDNFSINLWGTNLTDTEYITEFFAQTFSNGGSDLAWLGQPATYGASIAYKF